MDKKICFVALGSLPLLTSSDNLKYVGGSELTLVLIGSELAKRDFQITFITNDEKNEKKNVDGIKIIGNVSQSKNYSFLKNIFIFWRSLKKANADIYVQGTGSTGTIPLFCLIHRRKYVKWIMSDSNILFERFRGAHPFILKMLTYIDIKFAYKIIVQNSFQKNLIEKKFKKNSVLIKNPIIIPDNIKNKENKTNYILWASTIRPVKQPEVFLKIAKSLPKIKFLMIGGESKGNENLYNEIEKEAKSIPNLKFEGFVPHHKILKYFEESAIFINTSQIEGFPNTFLESWINSTPVVSLNVDPDEIICNKKLGFHSKTFEQLILDINTLFFNDNLRKEIGLNGKKYVEQNHDVKKITSEFEDLIIS